MPQVKRPLYIKVLRTILNPKWVDRQYHNWIEYRVNRKWKEIDLNSGNNTAAIKVTDHQEKILSDLRQNGVAVYDFKELTKDEFQLIKNVELEFDSWMKERINQGNGNSAKKIYELKKYNKVENILTGESPLIQLALSDLILNIAKNYFNDKTKLYLADYWHTIISNNSDRIASQNWHRDPEDKIILKVFVYINDINEENGAFEYVKKSANGQIFENIHPQNLFVSNYGTSINETIDNEFAENIFKASFPKYSIIFADTTGFHRGGYAISGERKIAHFIFTSAFTPFDYMTVFKSGDDSIKPFLKYVRTIK